MRDSCFFTQTVCKVCFWLVWQMQNWGRLRWHEERRVMQNKNPRKNSASCYRARDHRHIELIEMVEVIDLDRFNIARWISPNDRLLNVRQLDIRQGQLFLTSPSHPSICLHFYFNCDPFCSVFSIEFGCYDSPMTLQVCSPGAFLWSACLLTSFY